MNYTQLSTAIQDYIEAADTTFVTNIPNFVKAAEKKIYSTVQLPALRKNVTGSLTSGNQYLTTPSDFISAYSIAIISNASPAAHTYLLEKDVNFIREAFPYPATTGTPSHYALFDDSTFLIGPTPSATFTTELHYFYYPESIVTASTTWLGDNFDTVLLYGSLIEANMFIKGEADTTAAYQLQFDTAMDSLKILADGKNRQDMYRAGQAKIKVP